MSGCFSQLEEGVQNIFALGPVAISRAGFVCKPWTWRTHFRHSCVPLCSHNHLSWGAKSLISKYRVSPGSTLWCSCIAMAPSFWSIRYHTHPLSHAFCLVGPMCGCFLLFFFSFLCLLSYVAQCVWDNSPSCCVFLRQTSFFKLLELPEHLL